MEKVYRCTSTGSMDCIKEQNVEEKIEDVLDRMSEYICDKVCKFPGQYTEEQLEDVCFECRLGEFVCQVLNKL